MVTIPTSYEAKEDGLNVLANISTILPDYQFTVIAGNTSWIADHKDQTVRFLMAMIKAMRFLNDPKNKEASIAEHDQAFQGRQKVCGVGLQRSDARPASDQQRRAPSIKGMETVIQLEVENKGLDKSYPAKQFIDDSYRLEALKRLGK